MFDLTGQVALITGGNGGLGLAFARGLVRAGASVVIWGRSKDKNRHAVEELTALGGQVTALVCDVTREDDVERAFADSVERAGPIDACFANAGGAGPRGYLHETSSEVWNSVMDLNVNSVVHCYRPFIRHLLEREAPGKLLVTSSAAAVMGTGFQASYATTKAAVTGLVRALAVELGRNGITANALLPGYVESDLTASAPQAFKDAARRRSCLGRLGQASDMEGVAVFLASRHSDYMTGQTLIMDGGHTIHPL